MLYENENGYLNILQSQDNTNIIFDFNSDKLASNYQTKISLGNKINTDYIDFNGTDLATYLGFIQPSLMNYGDANSAQILNGNYLKNLTVGGNVNTTFNISDGSIVHSSGIMSITEIWCWYIFISTINKIDE